MPAIYVDDDDLLRQTVARRLLRCGSEVVEAASGEAAIEVAKRNDLNGALLDVDLPGINGLETYRRLRGLQPGLAAAVMSGSLTADTRRSFLDLGALVRCLVDKPCPFSQLQGALLSVL